jgi:hypothetical protein
MLGRGSKSTAIKATLASPATCIIKFHPTLYEMAVNMLPFLGFPKDGFYIEDCFVRDYRAQDRALGYADLIKLFARRSAHGSDAGRARHLRARRLTRGSRGALKRPQGQRHSRRCW